LIEDSDDDVREQVSEFLQRPNVLRSSATRQLAVRIAASRYSSLLVEALSRHQDSLIPLAPVFDAVCGQLTANLVDAGRRGERQDGLALDRFVPLILRLYEQAEDARNSGLRTKCLDWWDRLLEARMGGSMQILGDLEAYAADM